MGELLRNAAARGDSDQVVRLLAGGVKNQPDEGGRNALHLAAAGGHSDVVAALLLARWDVNAQDSAGYTALQRAAAEGHVEVVKQLIKHGANVNIQDKVYGNTALHEACWKGYSKCVEALCQANKVNLQIKNFGGFAPLHLACQNGHNQSCRELLMANCNPDIQNNYGDTPLHTSARYGHAGVTRILISADCHMSDQNKNGDTALHITAAMGRRKLTRILLEAGCDPNRRNKQNERAKDIAIRKDLNEIIDIIDRTVPIKRRDKPKEKEKTKKGNDKKREKNESGSSKDSSSRPKEKKKHKGDHQVAFEKTIDTKWSPYGCHYYPDPKTFPKPKLDSLPHEPLKKGEQYYLDLAGNIRKGPVGVGYTCYCAPFFRHMEERLDRDKKELKDHIDAAQIRLDKKVTHLEAKTRGQLNEITRTMALERAKCQQRHLHLEQWLIRGTIFRNSEKLKPSESFLNSIPKSRSLENIMEEKNAANRFNACRSVEMLNDKNTNIISDDDLKNRSSSREGKESGKGSSEVVGLGTSDGEEQTRSTDEEKIDSFRKGRLSVDEVDGRSLRTTREISERIDEVLRNGDGPESMELLYDEMMKWRNYHNNKTNDQDIFLRKKERGKERSPFRELNPDKGFVNQRDEARRRSYHDILKNDTRPSGSVEEPERKSVEEIVAKFQKQETVKELVAKIQRKTGLIHKSAQKWKENKLKNKEKDVQDKIKTELFVSKKEPENEKSLHQPDYENVGYRDMPKDALSRLPYRCRDTVYSPSQDLDSFFPPQEYQRNFQKSPDDPYFQEASRSGYNLQYDRNEEFERRLFPSRHDLNASPYGMYDSHRDIKGAKIEFDDRNLIGRPGSFPHAYSPTQNDSGYSTKPYGGSSTGPSPSLSGKGV